MSIPEHISSTRIHTRAALQQQDYTFKPCRQHQDFFRSMPDPEFAIYNRLHYYCLIHSAEKRIPGAAHWTRRDWFTRAGLETPPATDTPWWTYEGDDLVLKYSLFYRVSNKQAVHE